ncbi:oligosaccharide flippase family protein [Fibrella arboris]|uniref:oligosaccharide flippase family protein n=1 Tax=Fibrella arboris TaxID=3242486 RepID=UPI003522995B
MKIANESIWTALTRYVQTWRTLLLLYGSQAVNAVAGLVYSKLLAMHILPDQLGQYNVQLAGGLLLYGCLVTPLIQSFKFTIQQQPPAASAQFYLGVLFRLCLAGGAIVAGLVLTGYAPWLLLLIWLAISAQCCFSIGNDYLNITFQHKRYALLQGLSPILNVVLLSLLLGPWWSGRQVVGLWLCYALLNGILAVVAWRNARQFNPAFRFSRDWGTLTGRRAFWAIYRPYASPLMLYGVFGWVIVYADRYIINQLLTAADVGYYAIGYSLGARMALIASPLTTHLTPIVLAAHASTPADLPPPANSQNPIWKHLGLFWLISAPICVFLLLFRDTIGRLVLTESYQPAFLVIPLIAIAYVGSLSIQFFETKFYATNQTHYVLWQSIAGALLNVFLNLWLIPQFGIAGAALSMIGSAFCQLLIAYFLFSRLL